LKRGSVRVERSRDTRALRQRLSTPLEANHCGCKKSLTVPNGTKVETSFFSKPSSILLAKAFKIDGGLIARSRRACRTTCGRGEEVAPTRASQDSHPALPQRGGFFLLSYMRSRA
jgi:hypothetical protein